MPKRTKGIAKRYYYALVKELARRNHTGAQIAGALLVASRAFGLRPTEWEQAELVSRRDPDTGESGLLLIVQNAKHHEHGQRTFGKTRTLRIGTGLEPHEINAARAAIAQVREYLRLERQRCARAGQEYDRDAAFAKLTSLCNEALQSARKTLKIADRITLYSARHQFAADAKASGIGLVALAALMGHASIETAKRHYGRRMNGWGGSGRRPKHDLSADLTERTPEQIAQETARNFRVAPDPENISAVQARNIHVTQHELQASDSSERPNWAPDFGPG